MARKKSKTSGRGKGFGSVRRLPSGNYQATYIYNYEKVTAPHTFKFIGDANQWLLTEELSIRQGSWVSPKHRLANANEFQFVEFSEYYIKNKRTSRAMLINDSTASLYRKLIRNQLTGFIGRDIRTISKEEVEGWFTTQLTMGRRTSTAQAYKLLRALMNFCIEKNGRKDNPCAIKGAQSVSTGRREFTPDLDLVNEMAKHLDDKFRLLTLVATYGVLRFGEVAGLQKGDFQKVNAKGENPAHYKITIDRQVKYFDKQIVISDPKSNWGKRTNSLHPDLNPLIEAHLATIKGDKTFVFTQDDGNLLRNDHYERQMKKAVAEIGYEGRGWRVHSLRHAGATAYANAGANIDEIQRILGDESPDAALTYIRSTGRFVQLANSLPGIS